MYTETEYEGALCSAFVFVLLGRYYLFKPGCKIERGKKSFSISDVIAGKTSPCFGAILIWRGQGGRAEDDRTGTVRIFWGWVGLFSQ